VIDGAEKCKKSEGSKPTRWRKQEAWSYVRLFL
jgi:hypothetical protein